MLDKISICSQNCRGLGDANKRRDLLNLLKTKNYSIICLQDTHFDKNTEQYIRDEWGYSAFFSSYTSKSRGTAFFFSETH